MFSFTSDILYDGRRIKAYIDSASDHSVHISPASTLCMLIDLDMELSRQGNAKDSYRVLQAHGNDGLLYEKDKVIMSKDEASRRYDVISACNPEGWLPKATSKVFAYATGIIHSHDFKISAGLFDLDLRASIMGDGFFHTYGVKKKTINIGGSLIPEEDISIDSKGVYYLKLSNIWNFSR